MNEALAREVERNFRRREEVGNTAGELAASRELEDVPIPLDSDPRKRHGMMAATAAASSGSSQMERSFAVADESRVDVEGEERRIQKFDSIEDQTTNCDENIVGVEQEQQDNGGSDHSRVVGWDP